METGRALIDVELGELALRFKNEQVVLNLFKATKQTQCYKVRKLLQSLKKQIPTKEKLKVGQRVRWQKSRLKGLLGVFMSKVVGPNIIKKIYENGSVPVKDPGNSMDSNVK